MKLRTIAALLLTGTCGFLLSLAITQAPASDSANAAPRSSGFTLRGTVTRVVDGDTIEVRLTAGKRERVRLIGIDTPERGDCYAEEATSKTRSLVFGKRVKLLGDSTQDTRDRYSRLLAYVVLPNAKDLGRLLVASGAARVYVYSRPFVRLPAYRSAETAAKERGLGLWGACGTTGTTTTTTTTATTTTTTTPTPPTTTTTGRNCDPSYPTVCIPPPPPDLNCKDIPYTDFKVLPPDPHRFDGDHDGIGCETS